MNNYVQYFHFGGNHLFSLVFICGEIEQQLHIQLLHRVGFTSNFNSSCAIIFKSNTHKLFKLQFILMIMNSTE